MFLFIFHFFHHFSPGKLVMTIKKFLLKI